MRKIIIIIITTLFVVSCNSHKLYHIDTMEETIIDNKVKQTKVAVINEEYLIKMYKMALIEHTKDLLLHDRDYNWFKKLGVEPNDVLVKYRELLNKLEWTIEDKHPNSMCGDDRDGSLIYDIVPSDIGGRVVSNVMTTPEDVAQWYLWRLLVGNGSYVYSYLGHEGEVSLFFDLANRDYEFFYTNSKPEIEYENDKIFFTRMKIDLKTGKILYIKSEESTYYSYC